MVVHPLLDFRSNLEDRKSGWNEDGLVRKITTEARGIQFSKNYDLSEFTHAKQGKKTSATLLRFISKLISHGEVMKASLSFTMLHYR